MKTRYSFVLAAGFVLACAAIVVALSPDVFVAVSVASHPAPGLFGGHELLLASAGVAAVPEEVKKAVDGMMGAFEEFKATNDARLAAIEKKGSADVLVTEKLAKIEGTLAGFENINQRLTLAAEQAKKAQDIADRVEVALARIPAVARARSDGEDVKVLAANWARAVVRANAVGTVNLSADEMKVLQDVATECKALNVSADTAGGYLAPTEYVREIIKGVTEASPARAIVRVRTTANKSIQIPKRTGQFAARRVGENETKSETTGLAYGLEELTAPEMYALIDISNQMLEDSAFDMEAEIREEATEQFAVKEGAEFVSGTGVGQCEGILTKSDVASTASGSAATIADADGQANGLISLFHGLKTAYARNAVWALNRVTLGSVRRLKDANKQYIWMPGLANGVPNTILGAAYVEMPDMPNEGANAYPIAFGDFRRGYTMVDRIAMEMLRDPYTQATSGNIRFIFRRRVGGQVTLAEAIRLLKCSA